MINEKILEQLSVLESIKTKGNTVMIKFDGERTTNQITVVLVFSQRNNKEVIQHHGDNLCELLDQLITDYKQKSGI